MNIPQRLSRSWRLSSWVNDINPVNWKTVLVGYMQLSFVLVCETGWLLYVLRNPDKGIQETFIGIIAGFLAGLSGITLKGRIEDRKSDYGYLDKINEGKRIDASKPAQVMVTGDQTNVTATMPVPQRGSTQMPAIVEVPAAQPSILASVGARSIVTDHDEGII